MCPWEHMNIRHKPYTTYIQLLGAYNISGVYDEKQRWERRGVVRSWERIEFLSTGV